MERRKVFFVIFAFVICVNFRLCYQQFTNEINYCIQNCAKTTVNSFWRQVHSHCAKDPQKLMDLYEQIVGAEGTADKCSLLLRHQVRKSLIDTCAAIFEEAFISQTFRNNFEIDRLQTRIFQSDPLISALVFERFIDAVYQFVDKSDLALVLFKNKNFQQMVTSLLHMNWKFMSYAYYEPRLTSLMAHYMLHIQQHKQFPLLPPALKQRVFKTINAIPSTLRSVYSLREVRLLNIAHCEYLYAPRELGPSRIQRTPFTWTAAKNSIDSDGDITLEFDDNGNIALGSYYDGVLRYLNIDENDLKPYFWLSKGGHETRWWQMGYYEDYVAFKNVKTNHILCATIAYDQIRRYVTLSTALSDYDVELPCRWNLTSQESNSTCVANIT